MKEYTIDDITFVVIGRNEAANLGRCFESIKRVSSKIIFIDSNSEDESLSVAKSHKIEKVVKLTANHYSASLGRSVGANLVQTDLIQFIDGDMALSVEWPQLAVDFLNKNKKIAVVHGFKREHKKNYDDYTIKADKKDHRSDYLQGAFCIVKEVYDRSGGLDNRFIGEEERDMYVRIHALGYEVWYHHKLMAAHYDFKVRGLKYLFFSDISVLVWIPLIKAIKSGNMTSYLYVYRRMILFLPLELLSVYLVFLSFFTGSFDYVLTALVIQVVLFVYGKTIARVGYFIIWKSALINFFRIPNILCKKVKYRFDII